MADYYIHENGVVNGATVTMVGEHKQPKNAIFAVKEDREKVERWLKNGRKVFWSEAMGFHLDSTLEETPAETPAHEELVSAPPEAEPEDASSAHYVDCLKAVVAALNATDEAGRKKHAKVAQQKLDAAIGGEE